MLIIGILLVVSFGYMFSVLFVAKMHVLERIGTSFLLGFGLLTLVMFCYSNLGIKISFQSVLAAVFVLDSILLVVNKFFSREISFHATKLLETFVKRTKVEKLLILLICSLFVGSLIISTYFPVYIWDALALYDFRAKVIAQQGFYTQIAKNFFWFAGYPLFTSLSHTIIYLFKGNNPQFLYSFIYISFVLIFYSIIRNYVSLRNSLTSSLMLASVPVLFDHSTFAYTNLPYTTFLTLGSIYLFFWFTKKKPIGYLILSATFAGLSTWTRSTEPFWVVNIVFLLCILVFKFKKTFFPLIIYLAVFLTIRTPWSYVNYYSLSSGIMEKPSLVSSELSNIAGSLFHTTINSSHLTDVAVFLYQNVVVSWFPMLILFLFCVIFNFKKIVTKQSSLFLFIIILYFGLLVYATYIYSLSVPYWKTIPDSARRMAMFFIPLMVFYIGLTLHDAKK